MKKIVTKVDDMFKAWAKADDAARIEGVKRLGLPENNTALDRAKAMGFGDTQYHGTVEDFNLFDAGRPANVKYLPNGGTHREAISVTPEPNLAGDYAGIYSDGTRAREGASKIFPVRTRGNVFDYDNPEHIKLLPKDLQGRASTGLWTEMEKTDIQNAIRRNNFDGYNSNEMDMPKFTERPNKWTTKRTNDPLLDRPDEYGAFDVNDPKQVETWKANNKDYEDLYPDEAYSHAKNTQLFDGANIRSKFAHFNPKLAGVGAGSILSANLMADELDLEHKPEISIWDSLMNTIGNVNQQQAQGYGDTAVNTATTIGNIVSDPSVAAELGIKGLRGTAAGLLLNSGSVEAAEDPNFLNKLQRQR